MRSKMPSRGTNGTPGTQLDAMTPDELGHLFPIILSDHQDSWADEFRKERTIIERALEGDVVRIEHIGSTAIPGIKAKPTIDLLVEIRDATPGEKVIRRLKDAGYLYSEQPENPPPHMMFMKGYTLAGFRGQAVHVHVRYAGDWDEIYFRDYLRSHRDVAREYERLKVELQKVYEHDREAYTRGKTEFVKRISDMARKEKTAPEEQLRGPDPSPRDR